MKVGAKVILEEPNNKLTCSYDGIQMNAVIENSALFVRKSKSIS
jgi:hypothetical protein